jgi:hypothetical protein
MAINESKASFIAYRESISFQSFDRLLEIIDSFPPKQNWLKKSDESKVTFFKIDYNPGPTTNYSVVINANLNMETYLYGHQICLQYNDIITPCEIDNL